MAKELNDVPDQATFTSRERLTLLKYVDILSKCIGGAERIHQTMVPLNYARHTLRALTLWLLSLPFALVKDLQLMTGPMIFLVSWLLFGVYEIGYAIEDPFQGTLRLSILCDTVRRDVLGDESIRGSAFQLEIDHSGVPIVYNDDEEQEVTPLMVTNGEPDSTTIVSISKPDTMVSSISTINGNSEMLSS
jgi:predicted membrane chloride channel (bestrophin family)